MSETLNLLLTTLRSFDVRVEMLIVPGPYRRPRIVLYPCFVSLPFADYHPTESCCFAARIVMSIFAGDVTA